MDTSQTEKNILNLNPVKFQSGAVAQAQGGVGAGSQYGTNQTGKIGNLYSVPSNELETADKENKYLNKLNMRMSKYG